MTTIDLIGIITALLLGAVATLALDGVPRIALLVVALAIFLASVAHGTRKSQHKR